MPPPAAPTLRRCTPADAVRLARLGDRLFRQAYGDTHPEPDLTPYLAEAFDVARLARELAQPDVQVHFALDTVQVPVGYGYVRASSADRPHSVPGERPWEILRFYLDAAWHGRGMATPLFRACAADARRLGADALWLAVWQQALRPQAFYRRMGLEVVGTTVFHFGQRRDPDFVMAMSLSDTASS